MSHFPDGKTEAQICKWRPGHSRVEAEPGYVWNQVPQTPVWRQHPGCEMPRVRARVAVPGRLAAHRERCAGGPESQPEVLARPWQVPSPPVCFPRLRAGSGLVLPVRCGRFTLTPAPHPAPQPRGAPDRRIPCSALRPAGSRGLARSGAPPGDRQAALCGAGAVGPQEPRSLPLCLSVETAPVISEAVVCLRVALGVALESCPHHGPAPPAPEGSVLSLRQTQGLQKRWPQGAACPGF